MSIPGNNAVLINVLSDKHTGCDLIIGATHLKAKHGFEERRRAQTESCITMLKEVAAKHPTASVTLCGDFNGEPSEPFYSTLLNAGYVSAFVTATGEILLSVDRVICVRLVQVFCEICSNDSFLHKGFLRIFWEVQYILFYFWSESAKQASILTTQPWLCILSRLPEIFELSISRK